RCPPAVRFRTPANFTGSFPLCQRLEATVRVRDTLAAVTTTAPSANRRSGSSVRTSIPTSPLIPCARPIRPTVTNTCMLLLYEMKGRTPDRVRPFTGLLRTTDSAARAPVELVDEVDAQRGLGAEGADDGTDRGGGPAVAADHL